MEQKVEYLTAESESGRSAIEEVMEYSYKTPMRDVPPHTISIKSLCIDYHLGGRSSS